MSGFAPRPIRTRPSLDCSAPVQAWRKRRLMELMDKYYSGVESVGDRGRSVNYRDADDLQGLMNKLSDQIALCDNVPLYSRPRIFAVPYDKWD